MRVRSCVRICAQAFTSVCSCARALKSWLMSLSPTPSDALNLPVCCQEDDGEEIGDDDFEGDTLAEGMHAPACGDF